MNTNCATRNGPALVIERNRIVWLEARIGKLISTVNGVQKNGCHVFRGEEDAEHILLKCSEAKKRRKEFCNVWLSIINCKKFIDLKD
jgi:hypothetical protein